MQKVSKRFTGDYIACAVKFQVSTDKQGSDKVILCVSNGLWNLILWGTYYCTIISIVWGFAFILKVESARLKLLI